MPTIKEINVGGVSYDIGGGLTEDVKQASLQIAEKVAYIDEHGQDYYDELYTAFYDNMWNVTNTLSNASTSNPATKTAKDGTYTAIISASTGYTLDGATVSVTMGGANVTSAVYSNGTISIPAVTGDVVITVVAVALTVVSISAVYTQSGTVYDTDSLDSLKADLVVTATFSDSSTEVVPSADYTLTGTLTVGTSTITVAYGGKTTTFTVTVTQGVERVSGAYLIYDARDITDSTWTPRVGEISATISGATKSGDTLLFDGTNDVVYLNSNLALSGNDFTFQFYLKLNDLTKTNIVFLQNASSMMLANMRPQDNVYRIHLQNADTNYSYTFDSDYHLYSLVIASNGDTSLYVDDTLISTQLVYRTLPFNSSPFYMSAPVYSNYIAANVQAVMIYQKVLTSSEISQNLAYEKSIVE